jgi:hypothetical protein
MSSKGSVRTAEGKGSNRCSSLFLQAYLSLPSGSHKCAYLQQL